MNTIWTNKQQRFLLYRQKMLVNMNLKTRKGDLPKSDLLGKAAIIERFEYSTSGSKPKKLVLQLKIR